MKDTLIVGRMAYEELKDYTGRQHLELNDWCNLNYWIKGNSVSYHQYYDYLNSHNLLDQTEEECKLSLRF